MPTPSSNQSPGPSSLPPFGFSTCPDDVQHSPRPSRQSHAATDLRLEPPPDGPSPPSLQNRGGDAIHLSSEIIMPRDQTSVESSTRATTLSPGPQSNATGFTSPAPSGADCEVPKSQGVGPDGPFCYTPLADMSRRPQGGASISSLGRPHDVQDLVTVYREADNDPTCSLSLGHDFPGLRTIASSPSSYLRPGSRFHGTQQSERQVYDVQVEIKHVDMLESFLCGYLRIQGRLTEDHPTLTTFFEGEIIGSKYSFETQHDEWGASSKTDLSHWAKFSAFRPLQKHVHKGRVTILDIDQRDNIFMRWKEHFLVPDHRVRTITGASFEGFYYICFNQLKGEAKGGALARPAYDVLYRFQQLELKHVPNRGCFSAREFR
ncbi:vesicle-mediated transporter Vid24 [Drechmeria coniospora]|uniref:Vesicle-mediated transporter Vid24 n=1 Tax=Drechmeria coniospora TaxID=98403 RepID=A0A151GFU0_DRECN|nr:vesicle-mediated transporter Vid24 [Drechmeria coniospora]KYK55932.1 vesicle-mediated transporter Vid24 [Drechmeria coniospora]